MCEKLYCDNSQKTLKRLLRGVINPELTELVKGGELSPSDFTTIVLASRLQIGMAVAEWGYSNERGQLTVTHARAETVESLQSFGTDLRERRCIIPVTGFFDMSHMENGEKRIFFDPDGKQLMIAGLWRRDARGIYHFVILTSEGSGESGLMHRVPVLLSDSDAYAWLTEGKGLRDRRESEDAPLAYIRLSPSFHIA